jgi:anti-sigma factor ChrR (cupin superfamily)
MATQIKAPIDPALASRYVEVDKLPWIDTPDRGIKMKVLYHNPETDLLTTVVKLGPGCRIPDHVHEDIEMTYVLEGSFEDDEGVCTAGNFVFRPKGSRHSPIAPNGAVILVFFLKGMIRLKNSMYGNKASS